MGLGEQVARELQRDTVELCRVLDANDFTARFHGREAELEARLELEHERYRAAVAEADLSTVVIWAGQGLDAIVAVDSASAAMAGLVEETERALAGR